MYDISFTIGGEVLFLPVPPHSLKVKSKGNSKSIDLMALGEASVIKDPALQQFSFKALLPGRQYPFVQVYGEGFKLPDYYMTKLYALKTGKKPARFKISRSAPDGGYLSDTDILVTLEDYTVEEKSGETGDFYIDISLKEYREYQSVILRDTGKTNEKGEAVVTEDRARPAKDNAPEYVVKENDSLWGISRRELNDETRYMEIAQLNGIKDVGLIYPGQVLKLPA